jgi:hypothetical protein
MQKYYNDVITVEEIKHEQQVVFLVSANNACYRPISLVATQYVMHKKPWIKGYLPG